LYIEPSNVEIVLDDDESVLEQDVRHSDNFDKLAQSLASAFSPAAIRERVREEREHLTSLATTFGNAIGRAMQVRSTSTNNTNSAGSQINSTHHITLSSDRSSISTINSTNTVNNERDSLAISPQFEQVQCIICASLNNSLNELCWNCHKNIWQL
jgi:hypothetical protein